MSLLLMLACGGADSPAEKPPQPAVEAAQPKTPEPAAAEGDDGDGACPDGRVAFPFWPGEYPQPVIQVNEPVQVRVSDGACGEPTRACTVPAGLYHPWAKDAPQGSSFASRTAPAIYVADAAFEWDGRPVAQGEEVTVRSYMAEGMCMMEMGGQELEGMCPGTGGNAWSEKPRTAPPDDQILKIPCADGEPGWVLVDEALQALPQIVEGQMLGYGEVGRSE